MVYGGGSTRATLLYNNTDRDRNRHIFLTVIELFQTFKNYASV